MKTVLQWIAAISLLGNIGLSEEGKLNEEEKTHLVQEVKEMMKSFNEGDAKLLVEKTHPSIYKLAGGEENFKESLIQAAKQIMDLGIKAISDDISPPDRTYRAGEETVCFLPKKTVMEVNGQKIQSNSFMIAAKKEGKEWKYLDGAGLRKNPDMLWLFFPELPKDIKLPENTMSRIE